MPGVYCVVFKVTYDTQYRIIEEHVYINPVV